MKQESLRQTDLRSNPSPAATSRGPLAKSLCISKCPIVNSNSKFKWYHVAEVAPRNSTVTIVGQSWKGKSVCSVWWGGVWWGGYNFTVGGEALNSSSQTMCALMDFCRVFWRISVLCFLAFLLLCRLKPGYPNWLNCWQCLVYESLLNYSSELKNDCVNNVRDLLGR